MSRYTRLASASQVLSLRHLVSLVGSFFFLLLYIDQLGASGGRERRNAVLGCPAQRLLLLIGLCWNGAGSLFLLTAMDCCASSGFAHPKISNDSRPQERPLQSPAIPLAYGGKPPPLPWGSLRSHAVANSHNTAAESKITSPRPEDAISRVEHDADDLELHTFLEPVDRRRSCRLSFRGMVIATRRRLIIHNKLRKAHWVPNDPATNTPGPEIAACRVWKRPHSFTREDRPRKTPEGNNATEAEDTDEDAAWEKMSHGGKSGLFHHHCHQRQAHSVPTSSCAVHGIAGCPPGGGATCWVLYPHEEDIPFRGQPALERMRARLRADTAYERLRQAEEEQREIEAHRMQTLERLEAWVVHVVYRQALPDIGDGATELLRADRRAPGRAGWKVIRLARALRTALHDARVRGEGSTPCWAWRDKGRTWREVRYEYHFRPRAVPDGIPKMNEAAWNVLQNQARSGWRRRPGVVRIDGPLS